MLLSTYIYIYIYTYLYIYIYVCNVYKFRHDVTPKLTRYNFENKDVYHTHVYTYNVGVHMYIFI